MVLCKVQKQPRFGDVAHPKKLNLEVLDVNAMQVREGGGGGLATVICVIIADTEAHVALSAGGNHLEEGLLDQA